MEEGTRELAGKIRELPAAEAKELKAEIDSWIGKPPPDVLAMVWVIAISALALGLIMAIFGVLNEVENALAVATAIIGFFSGLFVKSPTSGDGD